MPTSVTIQAPAAKRQQVFRNHNGTREVEDIFLEDIGAEVDVNPDKVGTP